MVYFWDVNWYIKYKQHRDQFEKEKWILIKQILKIIPFVSVTSIQWFYLKIKAVTRNYFFMRKKLNDYKINAYVREVNMRWFTSRLARQTLAYRYFYASPDKLPFSLPLSFSVSLSYKGLIPEWLGRWSNGSDGENGLNVNKLKTEYSNRLYKICLRKIVKTGRTRMSLNGRKKITTILQIRRPQFCPVFFHAGSCCAASSRSKQMVEHLHMKLLFQ